MNKKNIDTFYSEYCTGCGLCSSCLGIPLIMNNKGFLSPKYCKNDFNERVCPASVFSCFKECMAVNIWGDYIAVYRGYSEDAALRKKASSGGVLSEIACFLLDSKEVDGIIHIGADQDSLNTKVFVSHTRAEVISHSGSRYIQSSPLLNICDIIEQDEKYAFIGKPCDVMTLKNYIGEHDKYKDKIKYYLSFFCAGIPSMLANKELILKIGCNEKIASLNYRGNGWPGYVHIVDKNGNEYSMSYEEAWGGILGRDKHKMCRLCMDGIGLEADIVCADAWYIKNNTPDFSERDGRNLIICRTKKGHEIYKKLISHRKVRSERYENFDEEMPIMLSDEPISLQTTG